MAYIEAELAKRRASQLEAMNDPNSSLFSKSKRSKDSKDDLYKIEDRYKLDKKEVAEGNVTLSTAMLTAIPEVDLGIE
jgi:hypothetical protein